MPDGSEVQEERFDEVEEFLRFIRSFRDDVGELKYRNRLEQIVASGSRSLIVDFDDLLGFSRELGSRLVKNPRELLPELEKHCRPELAAIDPAYASKLRRFNIRIRGLPERTSLRTIRTEHLNTLVSIEGIVVRSTPIKSLLLVGRFSCKRCGGKQDLPQSGELLRFPALCSDPSCGAKGSSTFELLEAESDFVDIQELRLQERPEDLPPGQLPRTADVYVFDDMVDVARPGDRTTLSGIVMGEPESHPTGGRYRTFVLRLHCNHLEVAGLEEEVVAITPDDEKELLKMSKDAWIFKKLVASLAPSIYGLEDEKEAIILQLMGGNAKELPDGVRIRGDVNVFLIGDPGCYSGDTRIVLGDGSMPTFKELADVLGIRDPGIYPVSLTVKNRGEEKATALHIYESQPIVEITLASGRKIGATPNNPFFTSKGWRRADKLKVGTRIRIRRRIRSNITKYYPTNWGLVSHDSSRNNIVSVPEVVDERLASLMGLLTAEGYVDGSHSIALAVNQLEKPLATSIARTIVELFGYRASMSVLRRKGRNGRKLDLVRLKMTNPHIIAWLNFLVIEKSVPSCMFMSPNRVVAVYLRWLFEGDGHVRSQIETRDRYIGLTSKNVELLRDVQLLLLRFGIESHIYSKSESAHAKEGYVLRVRDERSLRLFARHIGFVSKGKRKLLANVMHSYKDARELPKRAEIDKIIKIESKAPETVYDLEVPATNTLIVNGIIGHNTAKSQLLKYVQKIAPRGLYTSGRGSTAAGLTATAVRERHGGYVLEAGALVLADRGIAAIDEFEKMRPEDRIAIHEAMEQQSYHPSVEILLADGRKYKIGEYVDDLFRKFGTEKVHGINCEILKPPVSDEIYSMELMSGSIKRLRIDRVSRHFPPDAFVSITYSNGRRILVTPDHPVYVFHEGLITTVPAINVRKGDFVPAPRKTMGRSLGLPPSLSLPPKDPREKEVALPIQLNAEIAGILGYLISEGCFYRGSSCEIIFANKNPFILNEMKAIMGRIFKIGYTPDISSYGIPSQRYISSRLYKWFMLNFPEVMRRSRWRRAPAKILSAPIPCVRSFLRSAFLGDGSVETEAICYRTASRGLAEDYQDLLLRLGIASRIVRDENRDTFKTYIAGGSLSRFSDEIADPNDSRIQVIPAMVNRSLRVNRHHDVMPTSFSRLINETSTRLGLTNNGYFNEHINGRYGITVNVIDRYLHEFSGRVDEIEEREKAASSMCEIRSAANWSQQKLSSAMLVKRGVIDHCERGGYNEEVRSNLIREARDAIKSSLTEARQDIIRLAEILRLNLRALRVRKVELVPNEGKYKVEWVYDVTVEPMHNFISQGVLLHNTCSVAKGGIVATLNARTAILAAANPALGRYDSNKLFVENANLPPTILSRFDLIFVLKDIPDEDTDKRLADHMLNYHRGSLSTSSDIISQSMLRKYLSYCKKLRPRLTQECADRLEEFFLEMRRQSSVGGAPMAITPRQLESLVRLSEARAKSHIRNEVLVEDAEAAIALMKRSLTQAGMDVETGQIDVDAFLTGKPKSTRDKMGKLLDLVAQLEDRSGSANLDELEDLAEREGVQKEDFGKLISAMLREGLLYSPDEQSVKRARR